MLTARSIFNGAHRSGPISDLIVRAAAAVTVGVVAVAVLVAHPVALPGQHSTPGAAGTHVSAPAGSSAAQGSKPAVPAVHVVQVPKSVPGASTTVPDATKGVTLPVIGRLKVKDPSPFPTPSVNGIPVPKRLNG